MRLLLYLSVYEAILPLGFKILRPNENTCSSGLALPIHTPSVSSDGATVLRDLALEFHRTLYLIII